MDESIDIDDILRLKSGEDVRVIGVPNKNKFYSRLVKSEEFKVVERKDVQFIHPKTPTLF